MKPKVSIVDRPLREVVQAALNLMYEPRLGEDDFAGLTNREVMVLRLVKKATQEGDMKAFDRVADRLEGKPHQIQTTLNSDKSYLEYIQEIADAEFGTRNGKRITIDSQQVHEQLSVLCEDVSASKTEDGGDGPFSIE